MKNESIKLTRICMLNYYAWSVIADVETPDTHVGGEEVQHALMTRYLAKAGYDVTSLVGDFGQGDLETVGGVKVRKTFRPHAGLPGLRFFTPRMSRTWAAMKAADADVYYVSCAGAIVGIVAAFCQRYNRRMVFRLAHDNDCLPGKLLIKHRRDQLLYEYGLRRADRVLAQTDKQVELLKQNYGVRSEVAGMFSDVPDEILPMAGRATDLLWIANMRSFKRPAWFVDVARLVPELQCEMAGAAHASEPEVFPVVKQAAASVPNLRFHGGVKFNATRKLFANTKIFVNTSATEGFPNTYLQAWANGVPVVATFDPDNLIARRGLGIAVTDAAGAAAAARALLANPEEWQACSARCRAYALELLSPEVVAVPYLAALEGR